MFYSLSSLMCPSPKAATTIPELLYAHGVRNSAKELRMSFSTLTKRIEHPETFTLEELMRVAAMVKVDFSKLVKLAKLQIDNPGTPPASERGRTANKG